MCRYVLDTSKCLKFIMKDMSKVINLTNFTNFGRYLSSSIQNKEFRLLFHITIFLLLILVTKEFTELRLHFLKKWIKRRQNIMELHYMIQIFQMYLIRHGKIHLIDLYHNKKFIYLITFQSNMKSLKDDIMSRQNSMHVFLKV